LIDKVKRKRRGDNRQKGGAKRFRNDLIGWHPGFLPPTINPEQ
jgi:hypothetical protein